MIQVILPVFFLYQNGWHMNGQLYFQKVFNYPFVDFSIVSTCSNMLMALLKVPVSKPNPCRQSCLIHALDILWSRILLSSYSPIFLESFYSTKTTSYSLSSVRRAAQRLILGQHGFHIKRRTTRFYLESLFTRENTYLNL